ncbi:hypothetical protein BDY19DRAFT_992236 [Irpex rosettiformis]|uniref:Uncharacterized protein n=1 Tax=Irpex rosettiformis TaxID=378272 RepID=A0ACB8U9B0_9APHY|nr:hypothetical protein BDY19DRAFT_992236 [Irpex rosettiformis]
MNSIIPPMDATTRTSFSHNFLHESSYRRPSFLCSTLSTTSSPRHDSPAHLPLSDKARPSQFGTLCSKALPTPPSSDVGSTPDCGCADDSNPASLGHTNNAATDRPSVSPRPSLEQCEWYSTSPNRRLHSSQSPQCEGLDGSQTLNQLLASYTFPPTGNTSRRSSTFSITEYISSSNAMDFIPPPPYRRTPPPMDEELAEALAERAHGRPTTMRRPSTTMPNSECPSALGLCLTTHLPTPSSSPPSSIADITTEASSMAPSPQKRRRLRIIIPETPTTYGPPSPPHPVTALYYPQSGAGDVCPPPPREDASYEDGRFPNGVDHVSLTSYNEAVRAKVPQSKSVRSATHVAQYSPHSPPKLARRTCISLPPEYSPEDRLVTPLDASFEMLRLHDYDYASQFDVGRGAIASPVKEHSVLVANLPQDIGVDLLSPLPLMVAPSYRLKDLQGSISRCLDATERVHLTLASSPLVPRGDTLSLCMSLASVFSRIKKEAHRPAPDLEILAKAHSAEWRRKYERVILSLDRNLNRFLRVTDEVCSRSPRSRHLIVLIETLAWYARKFEDVRHRIEVFQDHISLLDVRAEYQELTAAVRAQKDVERIRRQTFKVATEEINAQRHALKEYIRQKEQDARARWN